jgi:hypothetical protein
VHEAGKVPKTYAQRSCCVTEIKKAGFLSDPASSLNLAPSFIIHPAVLPLADSCSLDAFAFALHLVPFTLYLSFITPVTP